jgi:hypothetical protein
MAMILKAQSELRANEAQRIDMSDGTTTQRFRSDRRFEQAFANNAPDDTIMGEMFWSQFIR